MRSTGSRRLMDYENPFHIYNETCQTNWPGSISIILVSILRFSFNISSYLFVVSEGARMLTVDFLSWIDLSRSRFVLIKLIIFRVLFYTFLPVVSSCS